MADLDLLDVLQVAWRAVGEPDPGVPLDTPGTCARCATVGPGAPFGTVVSAQYGDVDRLRGRAAPGPLVWCAPCAWGHRHSPLRTRPHLIAPGRCEAVDPAGLHRTLGGPLAPTIAVIVPLSRHKHLAPFATWGAVTTDDATLRWSRADAALLAVLAGLRDLGVPEAALRVPDPPMAALAALDLPARAAALTCWVRLDSWRLGRRPWLEVALRATRARTRPAVPAAMVRHGRRHPAVKPARPSREGDTTTPAHDFEALRHAW